MPPKLSRTELELLANSFSDHDICSDDGSSSGRSSPVEPLVFHQLELLANSFSDHDICSDDGLSPGRSSPVEPLVFHQLELLANSFSDHDICSDDGSSSGRSSPVEPLVFHQLELLANSFSDHVIHSDDGSSAMPLHSDDGFSPGRWLPDHPSDSSSQCMSESSISDQDQGVEGEYAPEYILKREPSENDVDGEEGDIIQLTSIGTLAAETWLDSYCIEAWLLSQWRSLNKPSPAYVPFSFISGGTILPRPKSRAMRSSWMPKKWKNKTLLLSSHRRKSLLCGSVRSGSQSASFARICGQTSCWVRKAQVFT
ncbi:hypothetical protein IMY05_C4779000400 [Salix suchowensis]|nr:hypothetical protein IMY05_C4779000400 [Salix suchowensis]